jgi:hypothetical protein
LNKDQKWPLSFPFSQLISENFTSNPFRQASTEIGDGSPIETSKNKESNPFGFRRDKHPKKCSGFLEYAFERHSIALVTGRIDLD